MVTVDRTVLAEQKDDGESVLRALATVLGEPYEDLYDRTRLCGTEGAKKPPICWYGSPYQPIPVAKDVPVEVELAIRERQEYFPGVTTQLEALRDYPAAERRQRGPHPRVPRSGVAGGRSTSRRQRRRAVGSARSTAPTWSARPGSRRSTTTTCAGCPG